jgi:Chitin synthase
MYRLYTEELQPLLACDTIFRAYSRNDITSLHERNLYELGEDRMLTTLMLQEFHAMQLSFVPEATCWTIVPHTFQILKSQRRRWINSTLHNMCELLKVETMCGVCFFSMKMVVIFDLLSTFLLPSGCVYLYYIVVEAIWKDHHGSDGEQSLSPLQIVAFAYVGVMTLPFVVRAQWDYFIWFFIFLVGGIPVFYFYLPIYAFWHMDDLSWGKTRQVQALTTTSTTTPTTAPIAATAATATETLNLNQGGEGVASSEDNQDRTVLLVEPRQSYHDQHDDDPHPEEQQRPAGTLLGECPRTSWTSSDERSHGSTRRMTMMAEF